jgi:pimeloyl-ACP methyl ester carboxylesterase
VLVHGLAGSTSWWRRNTGPLSKHHRVHLVDLPGYGSLRGREFSISRGAEWLSDFLNGVGFTRGVLIGHSMGALIATLFTAQHPEQVERLVLAAPAISLPRATIRANLLPLAAAGWYAHPRFLPTLAWDAARAGMRTLFRSANELLTMNIDEEIAAIRCPTLLIFGERDPLVPVSVGHALNEALADSQLIVIPRAGHVVMFDQPAAFNNAVLEFAA